MGNGPFSVVCGDDHRNAQRFESYSDAERAAQEMSLTAWNRVGEVRRRTGRTSARFENGREVGWLGTDGTVGAREQWIEASR